MDKIDLILWIVSGGFGLMIVMWHSLNGRIDKTDLRMEKMNEKFDALVEKTSEIDKRLYGIETVLHMKECCVLKQDQGLKKAE
jgi:hypothetical protein